VRRCRTLGGFLAGILEYLLQFGHARDYHAYGQGFKLSQQPEVVQVAVEEWVFVVPFNLNADAVLKVVDFVRGARYLNAIDH
jgi:hypothetical protein